MLALIKLNDAAQEFYAKRFNTTLKSHPELTASWLEKKFDRFYIVESTSHREEEFTVSMELRYGLRSQEANKYGRGNQIAYDRYIATTSFDIKYLEDPQSYIDLLDEELLKMN
jgi:hypothetical protein